MYNYCFSLLELSKSNKLIWCHSICLWIHFSQKHLFFTIFKRSDAIFSQFSKETTQFFHNFQKKRRDFSQLVWYRTPSQFWEKNAVTVGCFKHLSFTATLSGSFAYSFLVTYIHLVYCHTSKSFIVLLSMRDITLSYN